MKSSVPALATLLLSAMLTATGCSSTQAPPVTSDAPLQPRELASSRSKVTADGQTLSLGVPLPGGSYSLAVRCTGPASSSQLHWQAAKSPDHGTLKVDCTSAGTLQSSNVKLGHWTNALIVDTNHAVQQELTLSLAPADD